jgi:uncharacterized membrane protein YeaQ/YmgE (transglycosylase-associated protein family)
MSNALPLNGGNFYHNNHTLNMEHIMSLIAFLIIGALAGWLAGQVTKGSGFGLMGNIVVGLVGSLIGGFTFRLLGMSSGNLLGSLVTATVGAVILLYVVRLAKS